MMRKVLEKLASLLWLTLFVEVFTGSAVLMILVDGPLQALFSVTMIFALALIVYWVVTPYNSGGAMQKKKATRRSGAR